MARRAVTDKDRAYIRRTHLKLTAREVARRLKRHPDTVGDIARRMGVVWGVPQGYVKIRDIIPTQCQKFEVVRMARNAGALHKGPKDSHPYCVKERWLEEYLTRRLRRAENEEIAKREGWWSGADLAAAVGVKSAFIGNAIVKGTGKWHKAFRGVKHMRGWYGRYWFEPNGTREALARLGVVTHRRAA